MTNSNVILCRKVRRTIPRQFFLTFVAILTTFIKAITFSSAHFGVLATCLNCHVHYLHPFSEQFYISSFWHLSPYQQHSSKQLHFHLRILMFSQHIWIVTSRAFIKAITFSSAHFDVLATFLNCHVHYLHPFLDNKIAKIWLHRQYSSLL